MCGIAGYVDARTDGATLGPMLAALRHRGPDDEGRWDQGPVHLGMRRLAIVDLADGRQPYANEAGDVVAVFNGEIYNHRALRAGLVERGHALRSHHADGDVICHLYEEMGDDFVDALNGMFAIALWDGRRGRLVLARDRVGIKPLYYACAGGRLVFGSEPKALLAHPAIGRDVDPIALHHYFTFKNVPAPLSAFAAIRQLRPGERAVFERGDLTVDRYWKPIFAEDEGRDEHEAAVELRALIEDSVTLQMQADVPVAAFLSGGVDSSAVAALAARRASGRLKTFTLVYDAGISGKDADRAHARDVARLYGTDHIEHHVAAGDVPAAMRGVLDAFDEPFSGVISTYFLAGAIVRHAKVALSGDGADELFASYLPHRLAQPLAMAAGGQRAVSTEFTDAALQTICARGDEASRRMAQYLADDAAKRTLYTPMMRAATDAQPSAGLIRALYRDSGTPDPLNRALAVDQETLLPDQVLAFVDRLSMAHGLEVRPPLLDHRIVEFAARIPGRLKIGGDGRVKHLFKQAVADLLPADLVDRPKEGFLMPINRWMRDLLADFVARAFAGPALARQPWLDPVAVKALADAHFSGRIDAGNRIWNLAMYLHWWQHTVEPEAA